MEWTREKLEKIERKLTEQGTNRLLEDPMGFMKEFGIKVDDKQSHMIKEQLEELKASRKYLTSANAIIIIIVIL